MRNIIVTTLSNVVIITTSVIIAKTFWYEGAKVKYENGESVFNITPKNIYPVWLNDAEKDQLIAVWEKTGVFGSIISKIRAAETVKGTQ